MCNMGPDTLDTTHADNFDSYAIMVQTLAYSHVSPARPPASRTRMPYDNRTALASCYTTNYST